MKKIGKCLKIFLIVACIVAAPTVIYLPFMMNHMNKINSMVVIYPNGLLMLGLTYQFIGMFKLLEENNPFSLKTVSLLSRAGYISLIMSMVWLFDLLYLVFVIHNTYFNYILVFTFLMVLFFGVFIALYILAELFKQATTYKEENDLTI